MSDFEPKSIGKTISSNIEEINSIQKEIEFYTKNIEHEKINLRLAKERHQKQQENLVKLQNVGKPVVTKDKIGWEPPSNLLKIHTKTAKRSGY